jgi:hypothetical protein
VPGEVVGQLLRPADGLNARAATTR